ncbi:Substance-P receptor [Trichoplax sp. H2]|nr:Substance-P receptor [Trichoplax sp. H2]|eukprot:RDD42146.1 Substance-P receptor [Trichoplax sp. H2]
MDENLLSNHSVIDNNSLITISPAVSLNVVTLSPFQITFLTLYITLGLVGLVGNLVVVASLLIGKHKLQKATDILLLNLALAGLLISVFHIPWMLVTQIFTSGVWLFGQAMCKIYNTVTLFSVLLISFTQMAICIDRYNGLRGIAKLKWRLTIRRAVLVVIIIWLSALAMCYPYLRYLSVMPSNFDNQSYCLLDLPLVPMDFSINEKHVSFVYFICAVIYLLVAYVIPCITMTILYILIIRILRKQRFKANFLKHLYQQSIFVHNLVRKERVAKIFITCVVFFFVCNLPSSIFLLFLLTHIISREVYIKVRPFLAIIQIFGVVSNAILYGSVNTRVKRSSSSIRRKIGGTLSPSMSNAKINLRKRRFKPKTLKSSLSQSH